MVLMDEIEKAHPDVFNILLQVLFPCIHSALPCSHQHRNRDLQSFIAAGLFHTGMIMDCLVHIFPLYAFSAS